MRIRGGVRHPGFANLITTDDPDNEYMMATDGQHNGVEELYEDVDGQHIDQTITVDQLSSLPNEAQEDIALEVNRYLQQHRIPEDDPMIQQYQQHALQIVARNYINNHGLAQMLPPAQQGQPSQMHQSQMSEPLISVQDGQSVSCWCAFFAESAVFAGELFANKYMQDLGQDIESFTVYHWVIKNYRKQDKRISSPEFECGGHKW